jgi:hypothetical protein
VPEPIVPLSEEVAASEAQRLIADAYRPTSYRDTTPVPTVGTAPPVAQPGRPPMSAKAVDDTSRMVGAGFLTLCAGGAVSAVLHYSGQADPVVVGMIAATPAGLAVPILALSRLAKRARPEPDVHHHYEGPVYQDQRNVNSSTRGVWAKNINEQ